MAKIKKILLIGNYPSDRQESMQRFHQCLFENPWAKEKFEIQTISPSQFFSSAKRSTHHGLNKFLSYLDKLILFPCCLLRLHRRFDLVHICDHSNALYTRFIRRRKTLVTCHDVLAIEAAMGINNHCPTSPTGAYLQRLILNGLTQASHIAFVSQTTRRSFQKLAPHFHDQRCHLIHNGTYQAIDPSCSSKPNKLPHSIDFIFHIGSNLQRKNREGIIKAFAQTKDNGAKLVFAGHHLSDELWKLINSLQCGNRIIDLGKINSSELSYLYHHAVALVFPSHSEGFGVPIVEAIEANCPVICSNWDSFKELLPEGYPMIDSHDIDELAKSIEAIQNSGYRSSLMEMLSSQKKHFTTEKMQQSYLDLYQTILS